MLIAVIALAGCSETTDEPGGGTTATLAVESPTSPVRTQTPTQPPTTPDSTQAPATTTAPATQRPKPASTVPGDLTFCDYLERSRDAAQQIEDPAQFVQLVEGAAAVAPGSIREDASLYAESVRKLALTVTGTPAQAAKADAWLVRNDAAIQQAQDNVNSYSLSTCGQPFLTGEVN